MVLSLDRSGFYTLSTTKKPVTEGSHPTDLDEFCRSVFSNLQQGIGNILHPGFCSDRFQHDLQTIYNRGATKVITAYNETCGTDLRTIEAVMDAIERHQKVAWAIVSLRRTRVNGNHTNVWHKGTYISQAPIERTNQSSLPLRNS